MNPETGKIHINPSLEEQRRLGLIPIPKTQVEGTINMNRHERRKWAALQRKNPDAAAKMAAEKSLEP